MTAKSVPYCVPSGDTFFVSLNHRKRTPMATFHFYLKDKHSDNPTLIYLYFSYNSRRLKISSGLSIKPSQWNFNKEMAKPQVRGALEFNQHLTSLEESLYSIYNRLSADGSIPSPADVKAEFEKERGILSKEELAQEKAKKEERESFVAKFDEFIQLNEGVRAASTLSVYRTTLKHLKDFQKLTRRKITFDGFDKAFYDKFLKYLTLDLEMSNNSIGKYVKTLKTFLHHCADYGIEVNEDFKKFKVFREESENIYLNETEIQNLFDLDLSKDPKLERVRDLFIVGCYTGLRFSDFSQLSSDNIQDGIISIKTQKTGEVVSVPIHPLVDKILQKYEGDLPRAISNQKMNAYLKELGQMAELDSKKVIARNKAGKRQEETFVKWELLTTHTARRSFATNLYNQGFPSIYIMKITGHKTEKAFLKYIKVEKEEAAQLLRDFWAGRE